MTAPPGSMASAREWEARCQSLRWACRPKASTSAPMGYLANDELERVEPDEREYPSLLARYGRQVDLDSVSRLVQTHHLVIAWRTCISPETGMSNNSVERSSGQHGRRRQRAEKRSLRSGL